MTDIKKVNMDNLLEMINQLTQRVIQLENANIPKDNQTKEMTDNDAISCLYGDNMNLKHKDCANKMGLSYGQIYSCRLEFTFKHIHKDMKTRGIKNIWVK